MRKGLHRFQWDTDIIQGCPMRKCYVVISRQLFRPNRPRRMGSEVECWNVNGGSVLALLGHGEVCFCYSDGWDGSTDVGRQNFNPLDFDGFTKHYFLLMDSELFGYRPSERLMR